MILITFKKWEADDNKTTYYYISSFALDKHTAAKSQIDTTITLCTLKPWAMLSALYIEILHVFIHAQEKAEGHSM